eukprot:3308329-Heterocapsa_arctica.AAC.1
MRRRARCTCTGHYMIKLRPIAADPTKDLADYMYEAIEPLYTFNQQRGAEHRWAEIPRPNAQPGAVMRDEARITWQAARLTFHRRRLRAGSVSPSR